MASMKPAMGMLAPATASNMAGPDTSLGHPPPLSANSSQVARDGAKVLVSCWNPPIPMRIGVIPFRSLRSRGRIPDRRILLKKCAYGNKAMPAIGPLLGHRHGELGSFVDAVGPALHDALVAGIEPHPFFAVGVVVAEQRALPAAERVPRHGH